MNIWLVTIGEPIPIEENKLRLHRTGILFESLYSSTNNKIVWWTSNYNHFLKKPFSDKSQILLKQNASIKLLKSPGYKKNVSIRRFYDHLILALRFYKEIKSESKPDIIVCSFPTMFLSFFSVLYAKKNKIPVLIDFRDDWPDIFLDFIPKKLKIIGKIFFFSHFIITRFIFKNSTGIISITKEFLKIGLSKAKRKISKFDNHFPLGYKKLAPLNEYDGRLKIFPFDDKKINLCFIGTLGKSFDLETIINTFNSGKLNDYRLFICGDGDNKTSLQEKVVSDNIYFTDYVNAEDIKYLLGKCQIGLCPYIPKNDFLNSIPGKAIEYMSEGLFIVSTLGNGILGDLITKNNIGVNYTNEETLIGQLISYKSNETRKKNIIDFYEKNFDSKVVYENYIRHLNFVFKNHNSN